MKSGMRTRCSRLTHTPAKWALSRERTTRRVAIIDRRRTASCLHGTIRSALYAAELSSASSQCIRVGDFGGHQVLADKVDNFRCDIAGPMYLETGLPDGRLERYSLPLRLGSLRLMYDYGVGAIQKFARRRLEIRSVRIKHAKVKIGSEELDDAVGFDDYVLGRCHNAADPGHCLG